MKISTYTCIVALTAAVMNSSSPALAQGGPPPQATTLGNLGCSSAGEIARFTGTDWVCSPDLTTLEGQNLDDRLNTLETQNLDSRVTTLEGETQQLQNRVGDLEANSVQFLRTVVVSPFGPDAAANGLELLAAVDAAAAMNPSQDSPVLIHIEPGVYDLGTDRLDMQSHVDIQGSGPGLTRILGEVSFANPFVVVISGATNAEIRELSVEFTGPPNTVTIGAIRIGNNVDDFSVRNVSILGPGNSGEGVSSLASSSTELHNVRIDSTIIAVRVLGNGEVVFDKVTGPTAGAESGGILVGSQSTLGAIALSGAGTTATLSESTIGNLSINSLGGDIMIRNSVVEGPSVGAGGGTISIAGSQFDATFVNGAVTCVFSYDASFQPLGANCQ